MRRTVNNGNGTVVPPTIQATGIQWTSSSDVSLGLSFIGGNGTGRVLIAQQGVSSIIELRSPRDINDFSGANTNYSLAPEVATAPSPRPRILAYGNITSATITGLTPNTRYCFRLYEVNEVGGIKAINYRVDTNTSLSRLTPL